MISCNIMGRLGNQMFQIATSESLAIDRNEETIYTTSILGARPTHEERALYSNTIFSKINYSHVIPSNKWEIYKEKSFEYSKIPETNNSLLLEGYFQSEKYFLHNKNMILNTFCFKKIKYLTEKFYGDLSHWSDKELAGVHVRRGDYLSLSHVHSNLSEKYNYYEKAINEFKGKKLIFFSDDINWCKKHFGNSHTYVNSISDLSDMLLLGTIPNKIIANSSFSWWSAWLFEKENHKIIAPNKWFENDTKTNDLLPNRWRKL
jgi:hypothetical protein